MTYGQSLLAWPTANRVAAPWPKGHATRKEHRFFRWCFACLLYQPGD
ncbi:MULTISPECIES: hypothetical protein [unclassified Moorena]|nr:MULTISPECIES: hypothetical protein [unclassified Moorena]NEQ15213.1 hypothetical protein [Moorena sp. SIO3E2]NEP33155.1 hypothetical protein [Moorena sp. SIO3B2]NEQ07388.1 hypothetical protein [Moorena sp. SIO4E2]NER89771.1 hypothetical protein [Moorena sp. SIO3A2]NES44874.1 hypothetical protein [Moorena sp. SIO2C4]